MIVEFNHILSTAVSSSIKKQKTSYSKRIWMLMLMLKGLSYLEFLWKIDDLNLRNFC